MLHLSKLPSETLKGIGIDFASRLLDGETISDSSITCSLSNFFSEKSVNGTKLLCAVTGGTNGQKAVMVFSVTTNLGQILSDTLVVSIGQSPSYTVADYLIRAKIQYLNDIEQPCMWTDEELIDHLNSALEELCREARVITDSLTEAICRIDISLASVSGTVSFQSTGKKILIDGGGLVLAGFVPGDIITVAGTVSNNGTLTVLTVKDSELTVSETVVDEDDVENCSITSNGCRFIYPLDARIIHIDDVTMGTRRIPRSMRGFLPGTWLTAGAVEAYVENYNSGYITFAPRPHETGTAYLTVTRLPLTQFDRTTLASSPEINRRDHPLLMAGILCRAYSKNDADTVDLAFAKKYEQEWITNIEKIKRTRLREIPAAAMGVLEGNV